MIEPDADQMAVQQEQHQALEAKLRADSTGREFWISQFDAYAKLKGIAPDAMAAERAAWAARYDGAIPKPK